MLGFSLFCFYLIIICLIVYYVRSPNSQKWWIKIVTEFPACTYYFGPFDSAHEAQLYQPDYLQDIREEGAQEISVKIQQCQPQQLTICEEEAEAKWSVSS